MIIKFLYKVIPLGLVVAASCLLAMEKNHKEFKQLLSKHSNQRTASVIGKMIAAQ